MLHTKCFFPPKQQISYTTQSAWNPTHVQAYKNNYWYWSQSLFVVNSVKFHLTSLILMCQSLHNDIIVLMKSLMV